MSEVEVGRITVKVSPDTKGFRGKLVRQVNQAAKGVTAPVKADFDDDGLKAKTAAAAKAARQTVQFDAAFNSKSLRMSKAQTVELKKQSRIVSGMAQTTGGMAQWAASIKMPSFGSGINPAGYVVILAAIAYLAAPLIGIVMGALMALPGLLTTALVPIAAMALGLEGLKYAAKQIEEPIKQMQKALSAKVADVFTPIFRDMVPLIQQLTTPMAGVIDGVGEMVRGFTDVVGSEDGIAMISKILGDVQGFLTQIRPGITDLSAGMLDLISAFTGKPLTDLGGWFNDTMADFNAWIKEMGSEGLEDIFAGVGDSLKVILDFLGELAQSGLDFISDPDKVKEFLKTIQDLADALAGLVEVANKIPKDMLDLFDGLSPLGEDVEDTLRILKEDIGAPFEVPWLIALRESIGFGEDGYWTNMVNRWTKMMADGFDPSKIDIKPIEPVNKDKVAANLAELTGLAAIEAQKSAEDFNEVFSNGVFDGSVPIPDDIGDTIGTAVHDRIVDQVSNAVDTSNKMISSLGGIIDQELTQVIEPLNALPGKVTTALSGLAPAFIAGFSPMVIAAATAVQNVNIALSAGLAQIPGTVTRAFAGLASAAETSMSLFVIAVTNGTNQAVTVMEGVPARLLAPITEVATSMYDAGLAIGEGLALGIEESTPAAVAKATELAAAVKEASKVELGINSPSEEYRGIGQSIIEGLNLGIDGQAYLTQEALKNAIIPSNSTKNAIKDAYEGIAGVMAGDTQRRMESTPFTAENQQRLKELNKQTKELSLTLRFLNADLEASNAAGDVAIQQEIDRVKEIQKRLNLEKKNLNLHKEALGIKGKENDENNKSIDYLNQAISAGQDFAMANANQFTSDLGISGNGAISQGISEGISWLSGALGDVISGGMGGMGGDIIVNNTDDAFATWQNQTNVQKKRYANR